ncbi:MAG: serine hydrolase [Acidobacteria bacterium]|nr:serine hydrolase [Acidobacteriota bacterium]
MARFLTIALLLIGGAWTASAQAPWIDPADDAKYLGPPTPLVWTLEQKVAGFRNYEKVLPARRVPAGDSAYPLPKAERELGPVELVAGGKTISLEEYFVQTNLAGLLVVQDGKIVYERYGLGNTADTRWVSYSVAKSATSLLIGAAIEDGYIRDLDVKVSDYLPRMKGSPYDQTSLRALMQMASGVAWDETYDDPKSDVSTADWSTLALEARLRGKRRVAEPGVRFNYNTAETNLVGTLLRSAIGNNLATYLSEKIWRPFGMESDAYWSLTEPGGGEFGGCCISATLRDYARLGLFALSGGRLPDGTRALPEGWMHELTTPSPARPDYGLLWWLPPHGGYAASGIFGQRIYIHPEHRVVIAQHAARAGAVGWGEIQVAMESAVTQALARRDR